MTSSRMPNFQTKTERANMTCQPIPKFSTTLNGHPVFIPAMLWHLPAETLPQAIEALRTIDEHTLNGRGVCRGVCRAADETLELCTKCTLDVYCWVGRAVCYFDHTEQRAEETWLKQYFQHRFGLCGGFKNTSVVHYSHEQITALRLEWLAHIIAHLEEAANER